MVGWRLVTVAAATVLGVGAAAAPALAKGADQATITGPGLQHPIVLGGLGEPDTDSTLAQLAEGSGLFPAMFGPDAGSALVADKPAGRLGPRYRLVYRVPDSTALQIRQDLYPQADGGPVTYTPAGQAAFGGQRTFGGWFTAPRTFTALLTRIGIPTYAGASTHTAASGASTHTAARPATDPDPTPAATPARPRPTGRHWVLPVTLAILLAAAAAATSAITIRRHHSAHTAA
jgi:hypothetical protein